MSHRKKKIMQKKERFQRKMVKIFVKKKVKNNNMNLFTKNLNKNKAHTQQRRKKHCVSHGL